MYRTSCNFILSAFLALLISVNAWPDFNQDILNMLPDFNQEMWPGSMSYLFNSRPDSKKDKNAQLDFYREDPGNDAKLTTNQGIRIPTDDTELLHTLKAGKPGPALLEDFIFRERITHFDHERIPERVVHARGSGAHGYFKPAHNFSDLTMASLFHDPQKEVSVFVRFSTVQGSRGSKDTPRDVRGFATKFYTDEGNWDLVANNIPVFFIQDAIRFPDIVHAVKPEPNNEIPQASSAHDTFYDFMSLMPESAHMLMWLHSDRAIPRSFRMQDGFGVHTFRFVNSKGKSTFVKFHWRAVLGAHSTTFHEATVISGIDPDFQRRDLWENIEKGNFPEYELYGQLFNEDDLEKFDFDHLDPTKIIREEDVPLTLLGKMVLNKNPDNFFAETEQVAFCPANIVNGIDFTNDPLLQGRLFSYLDTQLTRLGGPNFQEIPINRPRCPWHNFQRDGFSRQQINRARANYYPNSLNNNRPIPVKPEKVGFLSYPEEVKGVKERSRSKSFEDFFSQATMFYRSLSKTEREHIIQAGITELGAVTFEHIKHRMIYDILLNIDFDLARKVASGIGIQPPSEPREYYDKKSSKLSQFDDRVSPKTRVVAVLLDNGFNRNDVEKMNNTLKHIGAELVAVGTEVKFVESSDGSMKVNISKPFSSTHAAFYDAVFVPGGEKSVEYLSDVGAAIAFVNYAFFYYKPIYATTKGIDLLKLTTLTDTGLSDGSLRADKGVITRKNGFDEKFGDEVSGTLGKRFWKRNVKRVPVA